MKTIIGLLEDIEGPPIRYGFNVTCIDSAAFANCEKLVICVFVISCCCKCYGGEILFCI